MTYRTYTRRYSKESANKMLVGYFLVFIDRNFSTDNYIQKVLQLVALRYIQGLIQLFSQQEKIQLLQHLLLKDSYKKTI